MAWTVMAALGVLMVLIYGHIRFALFNRFERLLAAQQLDGAAQALAQLRLGVSVNLALGVVVIAVVIALALIRV